MRGGHLSNTNIDQLLTQPLSLDIDSRIDDIFLKINFTRKF
jgi:hypothetical protein